MPETEQQRVYEEGDECPACGYGHPAFPEHVGLSPAFADDDPRRGVLCSDCGWSQRHNDVRGSGAMVIAMPETEQQQASAELLAEAARDRHALNFAREAYEAAKARANSSFAAAWGSFFQEPEHMGQGMTEFSSMLNRRAEALAKRKGAVDGPD